jgi:hypothetical protein
VTHPANGLRLHPVAPRTRPKPSELEWSALAPDLRAGIDAGVSSAERGEFADLSPTETEHYLETGELPERVERWLDSYDSRPST